MFKKILILATLIFAISCTNNTHSKELLAANEWKVISIIDSNEFSKHPWMRFDLTENKVNGNAGCNNFFGNIEVTDTSITFGTLGATKMMCLDMTTEKAFFKALEKVTSFELENDVLVFLNKEGQRIMTLHTKLKQ